ncbi:MAG: hypothetical protein H6744_04950 [Deltaproteobacteria bacterium]|nr:hypothetical protein [Deltaproteobacteria bacterium]MCB9786025.1 hypothetical protein [Deltaproteobacteria bacterium]
MKRHPLLGLAALLCCTSPWACGDEPPPPTASGPTLIAPPHVSDFGDPRWAPVAEGETVVARVGAAPITLSAVRDTAAATPGLTPRAALDRLVELEVLAQEAARRGLDSRPGPQRAWREALSQQTLHDFEHSVHPEDMPMKQVRAIYNVPKVRQRYDHHDAWNMSYLMLSCCAATTENCDTEEIQNCFAEAARAIEVAYTELKAQTQEVEPDVDKVDALMRKYREDNETRWPNFAYREQPFYYDPDKPHSEQKGYNVIAENVARTVIDAPFGVLQPPVQSAFGWHLVMKKAHEPASHKTPDDPEVAADIRQNAFPSYLRARFEEWMERLMKGSGAQLFPERLSLLEGGPPAGNAP